MLPFLPLLQYTKPARAAKAVLPPEKAVLPPKMQEAWPDSLEPTVHDEEHDLVLH
jgi:hypothetical protein